MNCPHHGEVEPLSLPGGTLKFCPYCMDDRSNERESKEKAEADRQREVRKASGEARMLVRIASSGIPERYRSVSIDGYVAGTKDQRAARDFAARFAAGFKVSPGASGMLLGSVGTGKTHLACAIGLQLLESGCSVHYTTLQRAVRRVKGSWERSGETETAVIASMAWPDLLILDEVGVQNGTDFERMLIFDVMNERYENRRSTLILANLEVDQVTNMIGARVVDRLREDGCVVVPFNWQSYRREHE